MLSIEVVRGFILTRIIPPLAGALTTWLLTKLHFLAIFHFSHDETAKAISEVAIFGVTAGLAFLAAHFSLKGQYLAGKVGPDEVAAPPTE